MSQCVPSWDAIDETPPRPSSSLQLRHECPSSSAALLVPLTNYEVAELTWENGQLSLHGFGGSPRVAKHGFKCPSSTSAAGAWTKPPLPIDDTLEAVVSQSTGSKIFPEVVVSQSTGSKICPEAAAADAVIPTLGLDDYLFEPPRQPIATAATDALVPCRDGPVSGGEQVRQSATAGAGAGRGTGKKRPRPIRVCSSQGSADVPATRRRRGESALVTIDSRGMTDDFELTTTTATETATATTTMATNSVSLDEGGYGWPEADSVSQSTRPQLKRYDLCEEEAKTCKKTRATAVHNQSERKRRDRINQKMKTLQKLVPNSTKSDKASILDEVIDYLKHLQAQVQVIKRMNSFMMPMPMSTPQFQMSMMANMAHMAQMAQLSMGMMDATATASAISRPATYSAGLPPALHHQPPTFLPLNGGTAAAAAWDYYGDPMQPPPGASSADALSALLACQNAHQPAASMDAYNTMATLFQQLHQQPPSNSMT